MLAFAKKTMCITSTKRITFDQNMILEFNLTSDLLPETLKIISVYQKSHSKILIIKSIVFSNKRNCFFAQQNAAALSKLLHSKEQTPEQSVSKTKKLEIIIQKPSTVS